MGKSIKDKVAEEENLISKEFDEEGNPIPLTDIYSKNQRPYGIFGDFDYQTDY